MECNAVREMDESYSVAYGQQQIKFDVIRRRRSTLEIAVLPDMRVEVTAPQHSSSEAIVEKVTKRSRWILKQQRYFRQFIPKTPEKHFVGGETHLYLGRRYRLRISQSETTGLKITRGYFNITVPDTNDASLIKKVMYSWYRNQASGLFRDLTVLQCNTMAISDTVTIQIREMKTRWGSLSTKGVLTLNVNLIKTPKECIDYVITHELCHVRYHDHSPAFYKLLTKNMPDWQKRKQRLEESLL